MGLLSLLPNAGSALVSIAKQLNTQPKSSYPVSATTPWLPLPEVKLGTRDNSSITPTSYNGVPGTWNNYGEFTPSSSSSITPTSYNGVPGTWNKYGEFTPSSTPWLPKPYGGDSGTVTSSTTSTDSSKTTATKSGGSNTINRPTYDYSMPEEPYITWEDAMNRARARFEPQYKSAVLSQNKLASDQQKRLAQALAARGYANARGGHRLVGEGDISQQQAMALENLRNQYDSLIGQRAWEIYSGEGNAAYNKLRTLLADRDAKNQLALQQYGLDLNAGLQRDQMRENSWNNRYNAIWNLAKLLADLEEE